MKHKVRQQVDRCSIYYQHTHHACTRRHGDHNKTMGGEKDIGLGLKISSNVHPCQEELVQKMPVSGICLITSV